MAGKPDKPCDLFQAKNIGYMNCSDPINRTRDIKSLLQLIKITRDNKSQSLLEYLWKLLQQKSSFGTENFAPIL